MKKGFTLIELLAVIIILAIIALIATPIILGVIRNAQNAADEASVAGYADAIRLAGIEYMSANNGRRASDIEDLFPITYQGNDVECNQMCLSDEHGVVLGECSVNGRGNYYYLNGRVYTERPEGFDFSQCGGLIATHISCFEFMTIEAQLNAESGMSFDEYMDAIQDEIKVKHLGLMRYTVDFNGLGAWFS